LNETFVQSFAAVMKKGDAMLAETPAMDCKRATSSRERTDGGITTAELLALANSAVHWRGQ